VVVKVVPSTEPDVPRFTARVRAMDGTPLGVFDAVRELDRRGTWIVSAIHGDLGLLTEGAEIVLADADGFELHGVVFSVML
jgi:hypothetical protein